LSWDASLLSTMLTLAIVKLYVFLIGAIR